MKTVQVSDELYEKLKSLVVDPFDDTAEVVISRLVEIVEKAKSRWSPLDRSEYSPTPADDSRLDGDEPDTSRGLDGQDAARRRASATSSSMVNSPISPAACRVRGTAGDARSTTRANARLRSCACRSAGLIRRVWCAAGGGIRQRHAVVGGKSSDHPAPVTRSTP